MYGHRFNFELQWLRAQGYAVIFGNPRGSLGYGQAYCRSIVGEWGDKDYADVMAIIDAAIAHPYASVIDAGRLGILGGSYGGFMVNWVISHTNRFRCAVTMRSVVNRFSAMGTSDLGWLRVPQYGDKPWWEDPAPYWQQSPLRYASQIDTPLLIEHQLNDFR
ncbi:prolyl oligopeptidase family serine peptidase [Sulfobacillus thermotolerans]